MKQLLLTATFAFAFIGGPAFAQATPEGDADEILEPTIALLPEDADLPDAVTNAIELPEVASAEAIERSTKGLETANLAREDGRAFGEAAAAAAQENRENVSRGSRPDLSELLPDQVPAVPTIPDLPNLPDVPGPPSTPRP